MRINLGSFFRHLLGGVRVDLAPSGLVEAVLLARTHISALRAGRTVGPFDLFRATVDGLPCRFQVMVVPEGIRAWEGETDADLAPDVA